MLEICSIARPAASFLMWGAGNDWRKAHTQADQENRLGHPVRTARRKVAERETDQKPFDRIQNLCDWPVRFHALQDPGQRREDRTPRSQSGKIRRPPMLEVEPMSDWCPFCGSYYYKVYYSSAVSWKNNDEGTLTEYIECLDCGKDFITKAFVIVKTRKVIE